MIKCPNGKNLKSFKEEEQQRLEELYELNIIQTPSEASFDRITKLASKLFQVPIAFISYMMENKKWIKSGIGLSLELGKKRLFDRETTFCQYVIAEKRPLIVNDIKQDSRFIDFSLVKEYKARFYAGVPIKTKKNNIIGTLSIMDTTPRTFSTKDLETLIDLSKWVTSEIELRADLINRTKNEQSIRTLLEITSSNLPFPVKVEQLLELGCSRFHFDWGIFTKRSNNDSLTIEFATKNSPFSSGTSFFTKDILSFEVIQRRSPLYIHHAGTQGWKTHPCYQKYQIEEYLGAPIFAGDHVYGSICFYSLQPHHHQVPASDIEFLQLMTQWIGMEVERIKSERRLQESQERFQQIAENFKQAFWIYDIKSKKMLYVSPAWKEIWGISENKIYEDPTLWDESLHPNDRERIISRLKEIDQLTEYEYRIFRLDGTIRYIRDRIVPVLDENKEIYRLAGITEDITEAKRSEDLLRKSEKLAAVGKLAASFAHEIRNPLTSIKGFIQLKSDQIQPYGDVILSELQRIEAIIKEFLLLAKPHQEIKFEPHDLKMILEEIILLLQSEANLYNIEFQLHLPNLPMFIYCEKNHIKLVLVNVLNNAIEAMPEGGCIHIRLGIENESSIYIQIDDEGIGIPEERLSKLGEPFYSNKEKGTGLGLMVSYKIVENHNGKIHISSEVNKGTSVKIILPYNPITQLSPLPMP
jgi:PAS domain S-box-containing protein